MDDDPRFVELYEEGLARVYRAAFLFCGDQHLAEEAAQEAFARALERWDRIAGQPWAVGWVMTTALNHVRRTRTRAVHSAATSEPATPDVDASLDLWKAVRALPPRQQEAVALHYIADLPLDEVATVMGCRSGTVKAHLWRARQQLGRHLGAEDNAGQ